MKIRTGFVSNSSSSSFAIIGFEVTKEIREKAIAVALKDEKTVKEDYWACRKCGFEPSNKKVKFCEKCGGNMDTMTRDVHPSWDEGDYELFEALGLSYYEGTENGDVAGFGIDGASAKRVAELNDKLVEMLGDLKFVILTGEYAC